MKLPGFELHMGGLKQTPGIQLGVSDLSKTAYQSAKNKFEDSVGFYHWPQSQEAKSDIEKTQRIQAQLREQSDRCLVIGIGGSHLGPAAILNALQTPAQKDSFPIKWLTNIDPPAMQEALYFCRGHRTAVIIISKSGNTVETLTNYYHLSTEINFSATVAITGPDSGELRRLANENEWPSLEVPPSIGGRFSVLTPVGLLPVALGGIAPEQLLKGAQDMRTHLEGQPPSENAALGYAQAIHNCDQRGFSIQYFMPYWSSLELLADWYVQLWAESLGKLNGQNVPVGPTPSAALGSRDQHSLLQLFKEGPKNKLIGFLDITQQNETKTNKSKHADSKFDYLFGHTLEQLNHLACVSTEQSLNRSGVPTYRIELPKLNAETLGAFLFFMQTACAFAGELYHINPYDQPGVEEAKQLLKAALQAAETQL